MLISRTAAQQIAALTGLLCLVIITGFFVAPKYSSINSLFTSIILLACVVLGVTILVHEGCVRQAGRHRVSVNEVILWNVGFVSGGAAVVSTFLLKVPFSLMFAAISGISLVALLLVRFVDRC